MHWLYASLVLVQRGHGPPQLELAGPTEEGRTHASRRQGAHAERQRTFVLPAGRARATPWIPASAASPAAVGWDSLARPGRRGPIRGRPKVPLV